MSSLHIKNECCRRNLFRVMTAMMSDGREIHNADVQELYRLLLDEFEDKVSDSDTVADDPQYGCAGCRGVILRGLFLVSGSVNDPGSHEYNLDFTCGSEKTLRVASKILTLYGFPPSERMRRGSFVLYFKSSDVIGEYFAAAGVNRVIFDITNARMEAEITGALNRTNNTDFSNINKSTAASEKVCEAIRFLTDTERLPLLDEKLLDAAHMRIEYPELSLIQLSSQFPYAISKSTLNARLRRIVDFADKYRKNETK